VTTLGFLKDGVDFTQLVHQYLANNCTLEITDPVKVKLAKDLMDYVIKFSYGYNSCTLPQLRFQMIFNSTMQELTAELVGLIKRSNAIWRIGGKYEPGTDFLSDNGTEIETKVYKNTHNMLEAAKAGTLDYKVFHGATYVLCYLIEGEVKIISEEPFREIKHWFWLKKIDGKYVVYKDSELTAVTDECLPKTIPICRCTFYEDKIIISKNTYCV
jgi:hypothetical protein